MNTILLMRLADIAHQALSHSLLSPERRLNCYSGTHLHPANNIMKINLVFILTQSYIIVCDVVTPLITNIKDLRLWILHINVTHLWCGVLNAGDLCQVSRVNVSGLLQSVTVATRTAPGSAAGSDVQPAHSRSQRINQSRAITDYHSLHHSHQAQLTTNKIISTGWSENSSVLLIVCILYII